MAVRFDQPNSHPDLLRLSNVVTDLLDWFTHPKTGKRLPGLLEQAWGSPTLPASRQTLLHSRTEDQGEKGGYRKPGSRPPSANLLKLTAGVQSCLDRAHQLAADELGFFVNSSERETALRRLPMLVEVSLDYDCRTCSRCTWKVQEPCTCRHRIVTRKIGQCHTSLGADLQFWEHPVPKPKIECPGCGRAGQIVIRKDEERMYCRYDGCDWRREGIFGIIALAS
jgi:hypothetical protein